MSMPRMKSFPFELHIVVIFKIVNVRAKKEKFSIWIAHKVVFEMAHIGTSMKKFYAWIAHNDNLWSDVC